MGQSYVLQKGSLLKRALFGLKATNPRLYTFPQFALDNLFWFAILIIESSAEVYKLQHGGGFFYLFKGKTRHKILLAAFLILFYLNKKYFFVSCLPHKTMQYLISIINILFWSRSNSRILNQINGAGKIFKSSRSYFEILLK